MPVKILHIATLFTPDGQFGGPTRVAGHQAVELARRGHEVTLTGAARGWESDPGDAFPGVRCRFFPQRRSVPGLGVAGLRAPGARAFVADSARHHDVVHIHLARDLVTLPAAMAVRRSAVPYVVQCHGMIDPSSRTLARPLDRAATIPALQAAREVLTLTPTEEGGLRDVAGRLPFRRIVNGVPVDGSIQRTGDSTEVLFLARLDERKRPALFVRAAAALLDAGVQARFTLVGPDGGQAAAVDAEIARSGHTDRIVRTGPIHSDDVPRRMAQSAVYVLPSVHEPFPMTVLEAMSVGVPVIVTETCGLAPAVTRARCGAVVDHGDDALAAAIRTMLDDRDAAAAAGARGRAAVAEQFSVSAVVDDLEEIYRAASPRRREGVA
ncbi:glycosyltransferase [Williamsia sp. SKLECPSW1]